ncbi:lipase [Aeromicrobium alkaliterrae]|uniref:Alpha/beta hydrolase n=1 Tax=Aeromicrobium alkaliterrae TaxID=302168 RepID=A0ABP4W1Z4_9ACTN
MRPVRASVPHTVRLVIALVATVALVAPTGAQAAAPPSVAPAAAPLATAVSSGWNNWSCKPSAAHPRPVVLVHGLGASDALNFATLAPKLVSAGYCVFSESYGQTFYPGVGGLAPIQDSAATLSAFVDRVRGATGTAKVDIVGHSEGSVMPAYYLKFLGGDQKVGTVIGFGSVYSGTTLLGLGTLASAIGFQPVLNAGGCTACSQLLQGSPFLNDLNAGGVAVPGPRYVSIVSRFDSVVTPFTNGRLTGAPGANITNITLQDYAPWDSAGHLGLAIDPNIASLVLHHLDPVNTPLRRPVPFTTVGI